MQTTQWQGHESTQSDFKDRAYNIIPLFSWVVTLPTLLSVWNHGYEHCYSTLVTGGSLELVETLSSLYSVRVLFTRFITQGTCSPQDLVFR